MNRIALTAALLALTACDTPQAPTPQDRDDPEARAEAPAPAPTFDKGELIEYVIIPGEEPPTCCARDTRR